MNVYRKYKRTFEREAYISILNVDVFRTALTQFRTGVSQLNVHRYRFSHDIALKTCPFCEDEVETEVHFLFECEMYNYYRLKYFGFMNKRTNLDYHFKYILTDSTKEGILKLARFVFYAMKQRVENLIEEM